MIEIETEQLMDRLESEFTKMVQDNRRTIHTVCYFFSRNREDAEDLFQEIFRSTTTMSLGFMLS